VNSDGRWSVSPKLYFLSFATGVANGIWSFVPIFLLDLHATTLEVGLLATFPMLANTMTQLSLGKLSDQVGQSKRLMVVSHLLTAVLGLSVIYAQTPSQVVLFRTIQALFASIGGVASTIFLVDLLRPSDRGRFMGIYHPVGFFGQIVGTFFTGYLIEPFGYSAPFYSFVFLHAFIAVFLEFSFKENGSQKRGLSYGEMIKLSLINFWSTLRQLPVIFRNGGKYSSWCVGIAIRGFGLAMFDPLLTVYLVRVLNASKPEIADLNSTAFAVRVFATPILGWIVDKKGKKRVMLTGVLLALLYPTLYVNTSRVDQLFPLYILNGFYWACINAAWFAWQMDLIPPELGVYSGLLNFFNGLAWTFGPLAAGFFGEFAGLHWGVILAVSSIFAGIVQLIKIPEKSR